jgi:hypothetical protein
VASVVVILGRHAAANEAEVCGDCAMKERPILFSGPMVRAILEGRKTQTRRTAKFNPTKQEQGINLNFSGLRAGLYCTGLMTSGSVLYSMRGSYWNQVTEPLFSPYGYACDRLYVKEATWLWCERRPNGTTKTGRPKWHYVPVPNTPAVYCTDHPKKPDWGYPIDTRSGNVQMWKYKSARFMPRWASRITLELTEVRVQRVQEMGEEDAQAEGAEYLEHCGTYRKGDPIPASYRYGFQQLWDSINAKRGFGWDKNPWVWALTFKAVK